MITLIILIIIHPKRVHLTLRHRIIIYPRILVGIVRMDDSRGVEMIRVSNANMTVNMRW